MSNSANQQTDSDTCFAELSKTDGALVGTLELLSRSPNVTQPSRVNKPVPVPSIFIDGRGEIHNILAGKKRINILHTKKGVMRSGDIHKNTQHDFVFEGAVEVWFLEKDGSTTKRSYGAYEYIRVPPLVPHIFHFVEDTVFAEWWEPEPFQAWFYTPYRSIVEKSFTSSEKGKLVKLVRSECYSSSWILMLSTTAVGGIVFGLTVGIMIGRRK